MVGTSEDRQNRAQASIFWYVAICDRRRHVYKLSDEQLQSLLLCRIQHPTPEIPADPTSPPVLLLEFLNYLQVSLEASYISPLPAPSQEPTWSSKLSAPPRAASLKPPPSGQLSAHHPSIFPPATPNPVPTTGEQDKQYAASDGAFLAAIIWGAGNPEQSKDAFSLLWSEKEKVWVAIYRLALTVCRSLSL
jgi:hypothetical protein